MDYFCNHLYATGTILVVKNRAIEKCLGKFVDERKAALLKGKGLPLKADAVVAGRTDKGVTGFQQVCSFCMSCIQRAI